MIVNSTSYTVSQLRRGELDGYGTGASVWPASIVLMKYLEKKNSFQGKTILDLGAGTGIMSIGMSVLGAEFIVSTDGSQRVVELAQENIERYRKENGGQFCVKLYLWGDEDSSRSLLAETKEGKYDVILVSDCVLPKLYPIEPLIEAFHQLSGPNTIIYLSYEHRYFPEYDPRTKFRELVERKGFEMKVVPKEEHDEMYSVDDIQIWKLQRR